MGVGVVWQNGFLHDVFDGLQWLPRGEPVDIGRLLLAEWWVVDVGRRNEILMNTLEKVLGTFLVLTCPVAEL